ncbi:hypothetical protein [Methanocella sp. MCL-LM]|uniref:hypothetical protein n=1 Tax=Methanocella sp. MCL-LM TaxID=3412035 RepID=UPI003C79643B
MIKKLVILLGIAGIVLMSGCTGTDQSTGVQLTATPAGTVSPAPVNDTLSDNETMPELDLPLPPDLTDL